MAFAHGSNDAQKTMGIITLALVAAGILPNADTIPWQVIMISATTLALGTAVGGWRIMKTMGHKVVDLEPIHGFAAETTAATVIYGAAHFGMPVSTTHVISSAIMGVGSSKGVKGVRWGVARNILGAWVLTFPATMFIGAMSLVRPERARHQVIDTCGLRPRQTSHNLHEPAKGTTMVRLMPKDEKFQELFVDYAQTTLDAARKLEDMIVTYDRLDERVAEIRALEHHGDETQTEVEVRLDRSFITPFDREDIHELVSRMDDVLDRIQEVAETFVIYDVKEPTDDARSLAGILSAQAGQLNEAIGKLEGLKGLEPNLKAVHDLENEADGLSRAAVARLFRGGHEAIEVIKWRDIYTAMENMIDAAEDVGEVMERIVAKNA